MSSCTVQSVAVAAGSVEVVCPKPRRISLATARPFRWRFSYHQEDKDATPWPATNYLTSSSPRRMVAAKKDPFFLEIAASPPPYFSVSPPSRVSNPLTQDARFGVEKLTPISSPRGFPIKVRGSFGNKPAVRIEGFECLDSVPAVA